MRLVLASTSPYRRQLLERLRVAFEVFRPEVDESALPGEPAEDLAMRLAGAKAAAARSKFTDGIAIGSDQVAHLNGLILGKPGNREAAIRQLSAASGKTVEFLTAVAVLDIESGRQDSALVKTLVTFRNLAAEEIARYLDREPAYDCAGSFKSEGLGITLVERIEEDDPTALVGLPLIRLSALLRSFGVTV